MSSRKHTRELLDFIIKQELDLEDYPKLIPLIDEYFMICKAGQGISTFTKEMVDMIIDWENGNKNSSLQQLLDNNFLIWAIDHKTVMKYLATQNLNSSQNVQQK